MSLDDPSPVITIRVSEMHGRPTIGSIEVPCRLCRNLVWLATAGQALLVKGHPVLCMQCAAPLINNPANTVDLAPGALEELELTLGRDVRDEVAQALDRVNRKRRGR